MNEKGKGLRDVDSNVVSAGGRGWMEVEEGIWGINSDEKNKIKINYKKTRLIIPSVGTDMKEQNSQMLLFGM